MRLVSSDGRRDVSYENCHLVINPKTFEIEAITGNTHFEPIMGIYSNEAKALKVMEMLRDAYCSLPVVLKNAEVAEEVIEMLKKKNVICAYTADKDGRIEYINNAVFQFPKDEEVEI